jgi:hypothetical protein
MKPPIQNITYPTNLTGINTNNISPPDTRNFFNNYFNFPIEVSSNIDAAIIAHFETAVGSKESARALASALIYTAIKQGLNPMDVLDEFRNYPPEQLDLYAALFLNFERIGTSFLGLKTSPQQNKYVKRSILP